MKNSNGVLSAPSWSSLYFLSRLDFTGAKTTTINFEVSQSTFDVMVPKPLKPGLLSPHGKPCATLILVSYEKINLFETYNEIFLTFPVFLAQNDIQSEYIARINSGEVIKPVPPDFPLGPGVWGQYYAVIYVGAQAGMDKGSVIPMFACGRDTGFPKKYADINRTVENLKNGISVITWHVSRNNKAIIDLSILINNANRLTDNECSRIIERMANTNGINQRIMPSCDFNFQETDVINKPDICQLTAIRRDNIKIRHEKNDFFHKASVKSLSFSDSGTDDRLCELIGSSMPTEKILPLNVATGGIIEDNKFNALEIVLDFSIFRGAVLYDYDKNI